MKLRREEERVGDKEFVLVWFYREFCSIVVVIELFFFEVKGLLFFIFILLVVGCRFSLGLGWECNIVGFLVGGSFFERIRVRS